MDQPNPIEFTADEFLAWASEQPEGRFELAAGRVVAMSPKRIGHLRVKLDATVALRAAIAARGLPCEALPDGVAIRIDDCTVYEPDAMVRCGPRASDDALEIGDPVIVVEVVSPSSRGIDTGAKLAGYFALPSVRHYLVVDLGRRTVAHHRRDEAGAITLRIAGEGPLDLDPPGLALAIPDLFASL